MYESVPGELASDHQPRTKRAARAYGQTRPVLLLPDGRPINNTNGTSQLGKLVTSKAECRTGGTEGERDFRNGILEDRPILDGTKDSVGRESELVRLVKELRLGLEDDRQRIALVFYIQNVICVA